MCFNVLICYSNRHRKRKSVIDMILSKKEQIMAELILQTRTLPESILYLIHTEKVMVREHNGEVHLIPVKNPSKAKSIMPIYGMYTDGKLTVDNYLERKRKDKELEM